MYYLAESTLEEYSNGWYIGMTILIVILMLPWVYLIIKYGFLRKLRVRFIIIEGVELTPLYLKKGSKITLPTPTKDGYEFVGWYIDKDLTEPYIEMPMPDENIKLYAKFEKIGD